MISHTHKFIIITPPKTGSVSITSSLLKYGDYTKTVRDRRKKDCFDYNDEFGRESKHTPIRKMHRLWDQDKHGQFNDYYKIGTVRNPWERVVSRHSWSRGDNFLFCVRKLTKPCCNYFSLNNNIIVNNYIRFESIQQDFDIMCDKIGLPRETLPHRNKTKHKHYTEFYNDETRQIVAERFAKDIEHFGYKFGE
jgi:hypothetical protein|tara:strand:+ start:910 stop:1488 length:579 start_codon:yes stop_codon:yes gene_type:complete